jgi:hypothetical protein
MNNAGLLGLLLVCLHALLVPTASSLRLLGGAGRAGGGGGGRSASFSSSQSRASCWMAMGEQPRSEMQSSFRRAAAALASAAVVFGSSPMPSGANVSPPLGTSATTVQQNWGEAMAMQVAQTTIAEEGDGVRGALQELSQAPDADSIMQALVRINDITEDDQLADDGVAKEALVKGLASKKQDAGGTENWRPDIDFAYGVLKRRLDPYNTVALRG